LFVMFLNFIELDQFRKSDISSQYYIISSDRNYKLQQW